MGGVAVCVGTYSLCAEPVHGNSSFSSECLVGKWLVLRWVMAANTPVNGSQLVHIIPCRAGIFARIVGGWTNLCTRHDGFDPTPLHIEKIDKYEVHAVPPKTRTLSRTNIFGNGLFLSELC